MEMESCWAICCKDGSVIIVSEKLKEKLIYDIEFVSSEEHWFDIKKAKEKYPIAITLRHLGLG